MPNSVKVRSHNSQDWKREEWVSEMVAELSTQMFFRWFDSGDMFHVDLAEKIYQVMKQSPNTRFWLPTRMHKIAKFRPIIAKMERLPNVVVRKSSDEIDGSRIRGKNTSTIICSDSQANDAHVCPATVPGNKPNCKANQCTACWDKNIKVIAYNYH
jgi:hypothetical protein